MLIYKKLKRYILEVVNNVRTLIEKIEYEIYEYITSRNLNNEDEYLIIQSIENGNESMEEYEGDNDMFNMAMEDELDGIGLEEDYYNYYSD